MTYILIHGSWHNGQVWRKVEPLLQMGGSAVYAPSLSGMSSIQQPATPDIGLYTHIRDIVRLIKEANLQDVILVGHSYGGFVISGVAELMPERVAQLVYLDAFVPQDNHSLFDYLPSQAVEHMRSVLVDAAGKSQAEGATAVWLIPPSDPADYGVIDPADVAWLRDEMVYTPIATFEEKLRVQNTAVSTIPAAYIRCTGYDFFDEHMNRAEELNWTVFQMQTGHDAMVNEPGQLVEILLTITEEI